MDPVDSSNKVEARGLWARSLNFVLGIWLFASAFAWPHSRTSFENTLACGALAVAFTLAAMYDARARHLNTLLSIWLFISVFSIADPHRATMWNNALVAVALFALSLVRTRTRRQVGVPRRYVPA